MNKESPSNKNTKTRTGLEIAVIGMAGRFPGARDIDEFWNNLKEGKETLSFFSDEELEDMGKRTDIVRHPHYVPSKGGVLEEQEYFDARFFDYTPLEAEIMDPQIRLFHECCWEALEDAGYAPDSYRGNIGLYAGNSTNFNWEGTILLSGKGRVLGEFAADQLTVRDFLTTRVSYKLNLKGPSLLIQTACSTSLVAIHTACRALLTGECKMALAGGVTVEHLSSVGYIFQEGMILSPDGHCRAFDADAKGTVFGSGVGVVVLKPLKEAIADRDHIYAVVKGSAVNNDGLRKVGYSAPSVKGQVEVIRTALRFSRVEPESITYVETHGTGTELGDPIEIEALTQAFNTDERCYCGIGSVKTNVGHLDAAAGVASFIKTVLALKHKCIPPSLHFKTPNPKIDFENSPFYVNTESREWGKGKYPLRAGVSSLGIGGTNAHIILEEAPVGSKKEIDGRTYQLIVLSAKTPSALDKMTKNLLNYLTNYPGNPAHPENPGSHPGFDLSDAAYTLQVGRKEFQFRKMAVCSTLENTIDTLSSPVSENVQTFITNEESQSVVFMFPGQGSQYVNMGLEIYKTEPLFREEMDRCFDILKPILGYDIKEILYPDVATKTPGHQDRGVPIGSPRRGVNQTEIIQPLLFIFEYSLATLLIKWGIIPDAMIGHSIGEYVAACLSGVISLDSALKLVSYRGKLIQKLPPGSMLSVSLPEKELIPLLNEDTALAAVNSPSYSVVSGPHEAIDAFEKQLKEKGYQGRRLHTSHAFHSKMLEPILKEFEEMVKHIKLNRPEIPFISNISGNWIRSEEAMDPGYWARHMRKTVRFWDGIDLLLKKEKTVFVEVGPGRTLSTFLKQHQQEKNQYQIINIVRHPQEECPDDYFLLSKIGQLWLYNLKINWQTFHSEEKRHRIPLPTYPFESVRYWIDIDEDPSKINARILSEKSLSKKPDITDWFYIPSWIRSPLTDNKHEKSIVQTRWLIFMDEGGLGSRLVKCLEKIGHEVAVVRVGSKFIKEKDKAFRINPGLEDDYDSLLKELFAKEKIPGKIVHLWGVTGNDPQGSIMKRDYTDISRSLDMGIYSLFYLTRAIGNNEIEEDLKIEVVTDNMQEVTGEEHMCPGKATVLGPIKVIPLEYSNIKCRSIDIIIPGSGEGRNEKLISQLLAEFAAESANPVVAYRGNHRWEQTFRPIQLEKSKEGTSRLRKEGVYLITGGLGGIGLEIAEYLVRKLRARLILTGRSAFPGRESWKEWLDNHEKKDHISRKIRKVQELEAFGGKVLIFSADVTHYEQMLEVVSQAEKQFGKINGIIHASGVPGGGVIPLQTRERIEDTLNAKVRGTLVLNRIFDDTPLDCFILCSSGDSILPGYGQVDYCAANAFLDAFANYNTSEKGNVTTAINWGRWENTGMAAAVESENPKMMENEQGNGMTAQEALEAFDRILETTLPQIIVNETDFTIVVEQFNTFSALDIPRDPELAQALEVEEQEAISRDSYPGPGLSNEYAAPGNETEVKMAHIWQRFFGYERVGINDDFFELGGDSLKAVMLMTKIHQEFDVKVSLAALFRNPTIKKITAYIERKEKEKFISIPKVPKKDYYALSSAQKRLFIVQQKELQSTVYNLTNWIILEEGTDIHRLEQTFMKLIKRHESLRTSFETLNGEPVQKIHKEVDFKVEYDEVSYSLNSHLLPLTSQFIRPFDLSLPPLMRAAAIKTEDRKLLLLVDMHHIISDEVSQDILMQDFMSLVEGEELPELRLQYKDYSEWQNKIHFQGQESEELKRQEEFWLKEFEGRIPILNLPIDNVRPEKRSFETDAMEFEMGKEETKTLKELVKKEGVTMFMLLLAVINVLLSKICGQEDIVIGTPTAGRRHADLDMIMGMFVNFLALRNYPSQGKTFKEFLKDVKKQTVNAFENQDYQFENLVEKLKLKRTTGRNPLFDVVFSFHNIEGLAEETGGIGSSNIKIENEKEQTNLRYKTAFYDVVFHAYEAKENISFTVQYSKALFEKETIEDFINYFKAIVSFVIKCLETKISEIEIISEEQKKRLIEKIRKAKGKFFAADAEKKKDQVEDIKADFNF